MMSAQQSHFVYSRWAAPLPKRLHNRTFNVVVVADSAEWVFKDDDTLRRKRELAGYVGPMIEFWFELLKDLPGSSSVAFNASAISRKARDMHPESLFSAAVYDVAVGKFDAAVANIWISRERARMTCVSACVHVCKCPSVHG